MSWAQEIKDFTAAFSATSRVAQQAANRSYMRDRDAQYMGAMNPGEQPLSSDEQAQDDSFTQQRQALDTGQSPTQTASNEGSLGSPQLDAAEKAISTIETGSPAGDYNNWHPIKHADGRPDIAIGRYQVLASNVPSWTKQWYGQQLTPEQFRANPAAQRAVFAGQASAYAQQYGWENVGKAWLGGPGAAMGARDNVTDQNRTSVGAYGDRYGKLFAFHMKAAPPPPQQGNPTLAQAGQPALQTPPNGDPSASEQQQYARGGPVRAFEDGGSTTYEPPGGAQPPPYRPQMPMQPQVQAPPPAQGQGPPPKGTIGYGVTSPQPDQIGLSLTPTGPPPPGTIGYNQGPPPVPPGLNPDGSPKAAAPPLPAPPPQDPNFGANRVFTQQPAGSPTPDFVPRRVGQPPPSPSSSPSSSSAPSSAPSPSSPQVQAAPSGAAYSPAASGTTGGGALPKPAAGHVDPSTVDMSGYVPASYGSAARAGGAQQHFRDLQDKNARQAYADKIGAPKSGGATPASPWQSQGDDPFAARFGPNPALDANAPPILKGLENYSDQQIQQFAVQNANNPNFAPYLRWRMGRDAFGGYGGGNGDAFSSGNGGMGPGSGTGPGTGSGGLYSQGGLVREDGQHPDKPPGQPALHYAQGGQVPSYDDGGPVDVQSTQPDVDQPDNRQPWPSPDENSIEREEAARRLQESQDQYAKLPRHPEQRQDNADDVVKGALKKAGNKLEGPDPTKSQNGRPPQVEPIGEPAPLDKELTGEGRPPPQEAYRSEPTPEGGPGDQPQMARRSPEGNSVLPPGGPGVQAMQGQPSAPPPPGPPTGPGAQAMAGAQNPMPPTGPGVQAMGTPGPMPPSIPPTQAAPAGRGIPVPSRPSVAAAPPPPAPPSGPPPMGGTPGPLSQLDPTTGAPRAETQSPPPSGPGVQAMGTTTAPPGSPGAPGVATASVPPPGSPSEPPPTGGPGKITDGSDQADKARNVKTAGPGAKPAPGAKSKSTPTPPATHAPSPTTSPAPASTPTLYPETGGRYNPAAPRNENIGLALDDRAALDQARAQGVGPSRMVYPPARATNILRQGLNLIQKTVAGAPAPGGQAIPANPDAGAQALASGQGAPTTADVKAGIQAIDPENKLTKAEQIQRLTFAQFDYWTTHGRPDKAQASTAAMLMYSKRASSQLGAVALAALDNNDLGGAAKAMQEAYGYIPDNKGITFKLAPDGKSLEYRMLQPDGKVSPPQVATADDMRVMANSMQTGGAWLSEMMAATNPAYAQQRMARTPYGQPRQAQPRQPAAPRPSPAERKQASEADEDTQTAARLTQEAQAAKDPDTQKDLTGRAQFVNNDRAYKRNMQKGKPPRTDIDNRLAEEADVPEQARPLVGQLAEDVWRGNGGSGQAAANIALAMIKQRPQPAPGGGRGFVVPGFAPFFATYDMMNRAGGIIKTIAKLKGGAQPQPAPAQATAG